MKFSLYFCYLTADDLLYLKNKSNKLHVFITNILYIYIIYFLFDEENKRFLWKHWHRIASLRLISEKKQVIKDVLFYFQTSEYVWIALNQFK